MKVEIIYTPQLVFNLKCDGCGKCFVPVEKDGSPSPVPTIDIGSFQKAVASKEAVDAAGAVCQSCGKSCFSVSWYAQLRPDAVATVRSKYPHSYVVPPGTYSNQWRIVRQRGHGIIRGGVTEEAAWEEAAKALVEASA